MADVGAATPRRLVTIELPVEGMDCANCAATVRGALSAVPGVSASEVFLAGEKAVVTLDPERTNREAVRRAIRAAGYRSPAAAAPPGEGASPDASAAPRAGGSPSTSAPTGADARLAGAARLARTALTLMAVLVGVALLAVVVGEGLGVFAAASERVPVWAGALLVVALGWPVLRSVVRNALRGRIVSHTLMSVGAVAALAVGQWPTAVLVVLFMRVGDYAERATTQRARSALRDLTTLAPRTARLERDGGVVEVGIAQVERGDVVVVRPGETLPVDGEVLAGHATVNQAAITGEAVPHEAGPGSHVFAATIATLGSLRIRAEGVGRDSTFGRIVELVERSEANKGETQRLADRFSSWYLPVVAGLALATYLVRGDLLAAVAVTVVACSCAFALATPVAMLASIGAAARRGLLIKGGRAIEALARADVLLLDKTGTVTLGTPRLTDVRAFGSLGENGLLALAACAEHDSEHPLAQAVRNAALERGLEVAPPDAFRALPGLGVRASVGGRDVEVGSRRLSGGAGAVSGGVAGGAADGRPGGPADGAEGGAAALADELEARGRTLLFVRVDGVLEGVLAAADALRPEVVEAVREARRLGIRHVELLTGDGEASARAVAEELGVPYRASLLPEDKIDVVRGFQARGATVVMVGDGVNDAPALVQADVGVAMGAAGSDVAIEAADVALMRDDWTALPELLRVARRTMGVVRLNIGFTAVYNLVGLTLAAAGILPPILAAALQSLPDLGIMGNSARLLRPRRAGPTRLRAA